MNQIVLTDDQVKDLEALEMAAEAISRLTGATVTVTHQIVVETENVPAFFALRDLLKVKPAKADPASATPGPRRFLAAWKVIGTAEVLTTQGVRKRLEIRSFEPGQKLYHPKHGHKVVVRAENPDDPDSLVDAGQWQGEQA